MTETENFVDLDNNIFSSEGAVRFLRYDSVDYKFNVYLLKDGQLFVKYDEGQPRGNFVYNFRRFVDWVIDEKRLNSPYVTWDYEL